MHTEHRLPGVLEAPAQSRRLVAELLQGHPRSQDVVLAASELVANAVSHGLRTGLTLGVAEQNGVIRVWVEQPGASFEPPADRGFHGLGFVERLSDRWGITEGVGTVTVWFEIESALRRTNPSDNPRGTR